MLADPLRARIVALLAQGPACPCHLVEDTGASQPNVSNHLRALREAGVVVAEPRGRYTYYQLRPERLESTADLLSRMAAQARATADRRRQEC